MAAIRGCCCTRSTTGRMGGITCHPARRRRAASRVSGATTTRGKRRSMSSASPRGSRTSRSLDRVMSNRRALITGGTRGIGLGIARALAQEGWDLMLGGIRSDADVASVLDDVRRHGGAVHYVAADLARPEDRARLIDDVRARFGAVHALVNNAGKAPATRADLL